MPAPLTLVTQAELEAALGAEKVLQLLAVRGRKDVDTDRVNRALFGGWGEIRGAIQVAIAPASIDEMWDKWDEADKAEIKRLTLSADIYYAHFYGLKAEELPDAVVREHDNIRQDARDLGLRLRTIGSKAMPQSSQQNELHYTAAAGRPPSGSARSKWRGF